jgi:hypothetical protein
MVIARAPSQVVRGADAALPVGGTRGSMKYAGIVAGVASLALGPDDRLVSHAAHPVADQPNSTNHDEAGL